MTAQTHELLSVTTQAEALAYRRDGHWGDLSIFQRFQSASLAYPDKTAIIDGESAWTYARLAAAVDVLASNLRDLGVERGDVIGVQLPNCAEIPLCHLALIRIGAILLPLHDSYREHELVHLLNQSRATGVITQAVIRDFDHLGLYASLRAEVPTLRMIIAAGGRSRGVTAFEDLLKPGRHGADALDAVMSRPDDIGVLMLSSGTTSLPKIAVYTHNNIICLMDRFARMIDLTPDDVAGALAPMGTGATGYVFPILPPLMCGATAVILDRWTGPTSAIALILQHRCTYATAIPTQKTLMAPELEKRRPEEFEGFRCFNNAGAPLPADVARKIEQSMGCRVASFYGASDGGIPAMGSIHDPEDKRRTTVGKILPGTLLTLRDPNGRAPLAGEPGEICWKGPDKSFGYLNDIEGAQAVFTNDGFYKSGDLGEVDADGYLRVVGRVKDMILRGGRNISPRLIEELLIAHPAVIDVAVVAMPHDQLGEQACAFVVLAEREQLTFEDATAFLKTKQIVVWQLPERLEIIDAIPRNSGGKIDKKVLSQTIADKLRHEKAATVQ